MKKLFIGAAILLLFCLSSVANADYIIKLKNGRHIETESYWEEAGQIKLNWQDGIASIPKKSIQSIVRVDEKFPRKPSKTESPPELKKEVSPASQKISAASAEKSAPAETAGKIDVGYYKEQKALYTAQFEEAYQRYLEASSRRDEEAKRKAWQEFNHYGGKVISLETELRKRNGGEVPSWWKEKE